MIILEILNRKCPFTHRRFGSDNYREPKTISQELVYNGELGALTNLAHRFAEILYLHKNAGAPAFLCNYRGTSPCTVILRKPRSPQEPSGALWSPLETPSELPEGDLWSPRNASFEVPEGLLWRPWEPGHPSARLPRNRKTGPLAEPCPALALIVVRTRIVLRGCLDVREVLGRPGALDAALLGDVDVLADHVVEQLRAVL